MTRRGTNLHRPVRTRPTNIEDYHEQRRANIESSTPAESNSNVDTEVFYFFNYFYYLKLC